MGLFDKFSKHKKEEDFPPTPKWKPNLSVNVDAVYEKARYYTGDKLQLAIFQHGTVAIFPNKVDNIEASALETLHKIYYAHADFKPHPMDDGNYLVSYSQPAFTIVFKDEIENHWDYIDRNHLDGICRAEVLINRKGVHNVFDRIGKICLYGRAKMFMDAQAPNVVKTFDPSRQ